MDSNALPRIFKFQFLVPKKIAYSIYNVSVRSVYANLAHTSKSIFRRTAQETPVIQGCSPQARCRGWNCITEIVIQL